jgi:uncharacterized protein YjbJ (UPF0337 family)
VPQEKYATPELCKRIDDRVSVRFRTDVAGKPRLKSVWRDGTAGRGTGGNRRSRFGDCNDSLQHVGRSAGMHHQEHVMNTNKGQVKGRRDEVEGKIKEVTGKVVGDKKLEVKGKVQEIGGEAREKLGDIRQHVKDSLKKDA